MGRQLEPADALDWVFAAPRTAKVATVTASGAPHVAPVWVARDGDRLVFNTGADTVKGRALRRDPRISLCFDDEAPPFAFVTVQGEVRISEEPDELVRWATIIAGRYMGADLAEQYGARNGVPGELLVIVEVRRVVGELGVAD